MSESLLFISVFVIAFLVMFSLIRRTRTTFHPYRPIGQITKTWMDEHGMYIEFKMYDNTTLYGFDPVPPSAVSVGPFTINKSDQTIMPRPLRWQPNEEET